MGAESRSLDWVTPREISTFPVVPSCTPPFGDGQATPELQVFPFPRWTEAPLSQPSLKSPLRAERKGWTFLSVLWLTPSSLQEGTKRLAAGEQLSSPSPMSQGPGQLPWGYCRFPILRKELTSWISRTGKFSLFPRPTAFHKERTLPPPRSGFSPWNNIYYNIRETQILTKNG